MRFRYIHLLMVALLVLCASAQLSAMSEEEHKSHHPEAQGEGKENGQGMMGGMMGGGMAKMMDGMMEKMGAPKPKDLYPSLMSISSLSDQNKDELLRRAKLHMRSGIIGMSNAVDRLYESNLRHDLQNMQIAVDSMQEHLALFESGLATERIIEEGQAPRQVAMQWFKREMNLLPPAAGTGHLGHEGWSWIHVSIMILLGGFFFCMLGMYYFKMKRATDLITQLANGSAINTEGAALKITSQVDEEHNQKHEVWTGALRVGSIFQETHDVKTFRLIPENSLPFIFVPGQFLQVSLNVNDKDVTRAYTIASSPSQRNYIEITVKRESEGVVSKHLHDTIKPGDSVKIKAPMGNFTFTDLSVPGVILIAGGVGITPMMSTLRYLCDIAWDKTIYLFFCCKTPADYIYREELDLLKKRNEQLHVYVTMTRADESNWDGNRGRIEVDVLTRNIPDLVKYPIHICGPVAMMDALQTSLRANGLSPENIKVEAFGTSKNANEKPIEQVAHEESDSNITFAASGKSSKAQRGQTVLDVAESCGINIDNSCRNGSCGLCKVKLTEGRVSMENDDALSEEDRHQGVVLACQAVPKGDIRVEA